MDGEVAGCGSGVVGVDLWVGLIGGSAWYGSTEI